MSDVPWTGMCFSKAAPMHDHGVDHQSTLKCRTLHARQAVSIISWSYCQVA